MSDLDSFFAKKDKTKKTKKKGLSNDDFEKKLSEPKANEAFKVKKFSANLEGFLQDQGEWNDFVDEDNKDYSGLKIQSLTVKDKEEEQREEEESKQKELAPGMPWVKSEEDNTANVEPEKPKHIDENDMMSLFRNRRAAGPKINDAIEFPDLGTPSEAYAELKGFQAVKSSGLVKVSSTGQNSNISTDNKYNALRNNSN